MTMLQKQRTNTSQDMYRSTSRQLIHAMKPLIKKLVKKSFKRYSPLIKEKETQYGFLYFIHGDTIASKYTRGNELYFKTYYDSGIDKISEWLCRQLVSEPEVLMRGSLKNTAHAFSHIRNHFDLIQEYTELSYYSNRCLYQPVPKAYKRIGVAFLMRLDYYPYPVDRFEPLADFDGAYSFDEIMRWIHISSQNEMHVSLNEKGTLFDIVTRQEEKTIEQRYRMLDIIVDCMLDSMNEKTISANFAKPNYLQAQKVDMDNLYYICSETFLHAFKYLKDDLRQYASSIVFQLNSDYVHHGLGLDVDELTHILHCILSLREGNLSEYKVHEETIFNDEAVKRLLRKHHSSDQIHMLIHQYQPKEYECEEKKWWYKMTSSMQLPNKVRRAIFDNILKLNELHISFASAGIVSLKGRIVTVENLLYDYDGYFAFLAKHLLECGGSVKHVVKAYQRFSLPQRYMSCYPLGEGKYVYTYNEKVTHDFYEVLFPSILLLFNTLKSPEISVKDRKTLTNALLKAMLSYNLDNSDAISNLASLLGALQVYLADGVLPHHHVLVNIDQKTSLTTMIALCTQANMISKNEAIERVMNTLKDEHKNREENDVDIRLTWDHLKMASSMLSQTAYLDLYTHVLKSENSIDFLEKSPMHEVVIEQENFSVGIYAHNNPIGVLGAGVKGVCISLNSNYRQEQLHPAFMNLCIHDNDKVILWGLLCRASNANETVYILNNFQGSINTGRISKYDVRKIVITALRSFVEVNDIDAVLIQNQSFNAINLGEGLRRVNVKEKMYRLEHMTRLDFSTQRNGVVDQDGFYLIN